MKIFNYESTEKKMWKGIQNNSSEYHKWYLIIYEIIKVLSNAVGIKILKDYNRFVS